MSHNSVQQFLLLRWFAANAVHVVEQLQLAGPAQDQLLEMAFHAGPNKVQPYGSQHVDSGMLHFVNVLYDQRSKRIKRLSFRGIVVHLSPTETPTT